MDKEAFIELFKHMTVEEQARIMEELANIKKEGLQR